MGPDGTVYETRTFMRWFQKKTLVTHYLNCDFHIKACSRNHKNGKLILNNGFLELDETKQVELNLEPCGVNKHHAATKMQPFDSSRHNFF